MYLLLGIVLFVTITAGLPWYLNLRESIKNKDKQGFDNAKDSAKNFLGAVLMTAGLIALAIIIDT